MYQNIRKYEVRYTDVDYNDKIKLSSLLSMMEESACKSADELHFGYDDIVPLNLGFIVVNYYVELYANIKLGDLLEIVTWPIKPRKSIVFRDFELFVNGQKVGVGSSRWCMIDTRSYTIVGTDKFFGNDQREYNTNRAVEFSAWKIPAVGGDVCAAHTVGISDYDHYMHVNNTKYADFAMDAFRSDEWSSLPIGSFQLCFVKQCKVGEQLLISKNKIGNDYYVEGKVNEELRFQMKITQRNE